MGSGKHRVWSALAFTAHLSPLPLGASHKNIPNILMPHSSPTLVSPAQGFHSAPSAPFSHTSSELPPTRPYLLTPLLWGQLHETLQRRQIEFSPKSILERIRMFLFEEFPPIPPKTHVKSTQNGWHRSWAELADRKLVMCRAGSLRTRRWGSGRRGAQPSWRPPGLPPCRAFSAPASAPRGARGGTRPWRTPPRQNHLPSAAARPGPAPPRGLRALPPLPAAGRGPRCGGGPGPAAGQSGRGARRGAARDGALPAAAAGVGRAGCSASRGTMGESAGARHGGGGGGRLRGGGGGGGGRPWCRRRRGWWGRACGRRWPGAGTTTRSRAPSPTAATSICGCSCWRCPWPCTWWEGLAEGGRAAPGRGGSRGHRAGAGAVGPGPQAAAAAKACALSRL